MEQECIEILTNMGEIMFLSDESTEIEEVLYKNIGNKIKDPEVDKKK